MRTKSRNRVTVDHAIDLYYNKHKKELKKAFGSERSAKAHMKYDVPGLPASHFKSHKQANQVFGDWYDSVIDPNGAALKQAKRDAVNKHIWGDQRTLNNRLKKNEVRYSGNIIGTRDGWDLELGDYWEVKGSSQVLGRIRAFQGHSEYEYWEYVDRSLI